MKIVFGLIALALSFFFEGSAQGTKQPFSYNPFEDLGFRTYNLKDSAGCHFEEASFHVVDGHIGDALIVKPLRSAIRKKQPVLIYQHWGGGDKTFFKKEAFLMARKGFYCISLNAPWHWNTIKDTVDFFNMYPKFIRLSVIAIKRLIDSFSTGATQDSKSFFYIGHSYGGTLGGLLAGVEPRINGGILMAGLPNISQSMMEGRKGVWKSQWDKDSTSFLNIASQLALIEPEKFILQTKWRIFHQIALHDDWVSRKFSDQFMKSTPRPFKAKFYDTGHLFNEKAMLDRIEWISRQARP